MTVLAVSSKTLSNVAWFINYVQTMELFPTKARVSGMNICATASTLAGMAAPYLVYLVRCISVVESTFSTVPNTMTYLASLLHLRWYISPIIRIYLSVDVPMFRIVMHELKNASTSRATATSV